MRGDSLELAEAITASIRRRLADVGTVTRYREPLIAFIAADDPRFADLRRYVEPTHMLPQNLLPNARSVVSFFLPFEPEVVEANELCRDRVAREWVVAYVETNALIGRITTALTESLAERGIGALGLPLVAQERSGHCRTGKLWPAPYGHYRRGVRRSLWEPGH
jgi:epoxyqueuosine reductase QueG